MEYSELLKSTRIMQGWRLGDVLGRGRRSVVWSIVRGEEEAALKLIYVVPEPGEIATCQQRGLTHEELAASYQQKLQKCAEEVRIMRALQGESHVVSYQDHEIVQAADGYGGFVLVRMERLMPLKDYVQQYSISQAGIVEIGISIAKALDICSSGKKGVQFVHGDVKVENLYYSREHVFKLGDFGLSMDAGAEQRFSGTQGYIAPECIKTGKQPASDVYALGMTLYVLLNDGQMPVREHASDLSRPAGCTSDVLWQVVRGMTQYLPEERFQEAKQVLEALERIDCSEASMQMPLVAVKENIKQLHSTWTDHMARHALQARRQSVSAKSPETESRREKQVEASSGISGGLDLFFREEKQKTQKRKQKAGWILLSCVVVLVMIGALGLLLRHHYVESLLSVRMTAAVESQNQLIVEVSDNTNELVLGLYFGNTLQLPLSVRPFDGQTEMSFSEWADVNGQMFMQWQGNQLIRVSDVPADTVCNVVLLSKDMKQLLLQAQVVIPAVRAANAGRTHTLWHCSKMGMQESALTSENPFIVLRQADVLLRAQDDSLLPSELQRGKNDVWLMNVTFTDPVDAGAQYAILLQSGETLVYCPLGEACVFALDDNKITFVLPEEVVQSGAGKSGATFALRVLVNGQEAYAYEGVYGE